MTLVIDEFPSTPSPPASRPVDIRLAWKNVVPPKSRRLSIRRPPVRKDSAAYVSLSSYSLVKEPDRGTLSSGHVGLPPWWPRRREIRQERIFPQSAIERTEVNFGAACGSAALVW